MEFKSLVMALEPDILLNALEYQMIPHTIPSQSIPHSILKQLDESPEGILEFHSLSSIDEEKQTTKETPQTKIQDSKDKSCLIM